MAFELKDIKRVLRQTRFEIMKNPDIVADLTYNADRLSVAASEFERLALKNFRELEEDE